MTNGETATNQNRRRLLLDTLVLGVIGGLAAHLFLWLLRVSQRFFLGLLAGYTPPGLRTDGGAPHQIIGPHGLWLVPLVCALGGLLSGALVYRLCPEADGDGTDGVIKSLHYAGGALRTRVAPVKMLASAITIGSGGSAGREGPTVMIAAGFGSIYAGWFKRPEQERRLIVMMGVAAGLAAIFRSPIGTAVFAVEMLYSSIEFESEGLLYCMIAAIVAYAVNGAFGGWQPLFSVPALSAPTHIASYGWYVLLGVASGGVATLWPEVFYRTRDLFHALPIPVWLKPAVGGLIVGLIGMRLPQVLGGGYGWMQQAIDGQFALKLLLLLLFAKMVAISLTVSSGGSGGILAPSLYLGAMLGGSFALLSHQAPAGMVVVGMAAVFGGSARVPIATLLMVAEMTGGYQLLVPAGLAVMLSYVIQVNLSRFTKYDTLYEFQIAGRADSPAHRAEQVETALRLIDSGNLPLPTGTTPVHITKMLQSGLALELPDGSQLTIGVLSPDSPWAGVQIQSRPESSFLTHTRIASILRGATVVLATPSTILEPGDRLLIVVQPEAVKDMDEYLSPVPPGSA